MPIGLPRAAGVQQAEAPADSGAVWAGVGQVGAGVQQAPACASPSRKTGMLLSV